MKFKFLLVAILLSILPLWTGAQTTSVNVTPNFVPVATSPHVLTASFCSQVSNVFTCSTSGGIATTANGTNPSVISMVGNTSLPGLTANTANIVGPPSASFTSWSLQLPTAVPANGNLLSCTTSGTNCLLHDSGIPGTAAGFNAVIQGLSGCNVASNVYTPQSANCVPQSGGGGGGGPYITYVAGGTGAIASLTLATNTKYIIVGNDTESTTIAIPAGTVIECIAYGQIQETSSLPLFTINAPNAGIHFCTLDGDVGVGTAAVEVTGASATNDFVENNIVQNFGAVYPLGWIVTEQSTGLHISRNILVTGLTDSTGIMANSLTGIISDLWIEYNQVTGVLGTNTSGFIGGIGLASNTGGGLNTVFINHNDVYWSGTGANTAGYFISAISGGPIGIAIDDNDCHLTAAAVSCFHIYGDTYGSITRNKAWDNGFVSSNPVLDTGDIGNTPVDSNMVHETAASSAGGIRVVDGNQAGNGDFESVGFNTVDCVGTGGGATGIAVTVSVSNINNVSIEGNQVHLCNSSTIGISLISNDGKSAAHSNIVGNTVSSTAGTSQTGIKVTAAETTAGTSTTSSTTIGSNTVSGVATGYSLSATTNNSAGAASISHIDNAQIVGAICDTVTTCVSVSAINSGTSASAVASVDHLQISNLQISGATTGIVTSTTPGSGTATVNGTQVGLMNTTSVTTALSFGGTNERGFTHTVTGSMALNGATPVTITLTGPDVFTSSTSYACTTADLTAASAFSTLVSYTSGTAFTLTGIAAHTDTIQYVCVGY